MLKKLQNVSVYFSKNRIRYFITCFVFLVLGVAPLLPNISGSGQYNLLSINNESHSLLFYYSELGLTFYYFVIALYYIGGIVLTVLGALIPPRKLFCALLLAFSGVFLVINLLSAGLIFPCRFPFGYYRNGPPYRLEHSISRFTDWKYRKPYSVSVLF